MITTLSSRPAWWCRCRLTAMWSLITSQRYDRRVLAGHKSSREGKILAANNVLPTRLFNTLPDKCYYSVTARDERTIVGPQPRYKVYGTKKRKDLVYYAFIHAKYHMHSPLYVHYRRGVHMLAVWRGHGYRWVLVAGHYKPKGRLPIGAKVALDSVTSCFKHVTSADYAYVSP